MGNVVTLPGQSRKPVCAPGKTPAVDDSDVFLSAIAELLAAVISIDELVGKDIGNLRRCLFDLDRVVQLFDESDAREKLLTKIRSLEASLVLVVADYGQANRAITIATLRLLGRGGESRE